jgi:hypothetical protein
MCPMVRRGTGLYAHTARRHASPHVIHLRRSPYGTSMPGAGSTTSESAVLVIRLCRTGRDVMAPRPRSPDETVIRSSDPRIGRRCASPIAFGNWLWPSRRRQLFSAASTSLRRPEAEFFRSRIAARRAASRNRKPIQARPSVAGKTLSGKKPLATQNTYFCIVKRECTVRNA